MKKLLVAAVAAALTFAGVSAPAQAATLTRPTITAAATIGIGDSVAKASGTYSVGTISGSFWYLCDANHTAAHLDANEYTYRSVGQCDIMNGSSGPQQANTITIPRTYVGNNTGTTFYSGGKYLYSADEVTDSGTYWMVFSDPIYITPPVYVAPTILNASSASDLAVGDVLSITNGSNFPEVSLSSYDNGVLFCNYEVNPTSSTNPNSLTPGVYSGQFCEWLGSNNSSNPTAPSFPFTLGANVNGWGVPNQPFTATGLYFYNFVTYRVGLTSVYHHYWSASAFVGVRAQTVTYDANTGSGSVTASIANGARALANGAGLSKPGFTFAGWNTAANGSGTAIAGGASYTPSGNVTLYAQWNRIPTPPAPAFTSPIAVAPVGGVLNLTGSNMAAVTSITVDDMPATISTSSSGSVSVMLPTLAPGKYDITIKNADGAIRFIDGLVVPDPNAKPAPKASTTYEASSVVKVTGSAPSAKQTAAVKAFVAQYKNAKTVTVYVRTSKAGLATAKKAAAAMLATAVKALGGKLKGSVVIDSTSERTTALDLVVTD